MRAVLWSSLDSFLQHYLSTKRKIATTLDLKTTARIGHKCMAASRQSKIPLYFCTNITSAAAGVLGACAALGVVLLSSTPSKRPLLGHVCFNFSGHPPIRSFVAKGLFSLICRVSVSMHSMLGPSCYPI